MTSPTRYEAAARRAVDWLLARIGQDGSYRHADLDGSGMVRGAGSDAVVSAVGDVFVIRMYFVQLGDYEMNNHVVEYELNRRIG